MLQYERIKKDRMDGMDKETTQFNQWKETEYNNLRIRGFQNISENEDDIIYVDKKNKKEMMWDSGMYKKIATYFTDCHFVYTYHVSSTSYFAYVVDFRLDDFFVQFFFRLDVDNIYSIHSTCYEKVYEGKAVSFTELPLEMIRNLHGKLTSFIDYVQHVSTHRTKLLFQQRKEKNNLFLEQMNFLNK